MNTRPGKLTPVEDMPHHKLIAYVEQWRIDADKAEESIGTDYAKGRAAGLRRAISDVTRVLADTRAIIRK